MKNFYSLLLLLIIPKLMSAQVWVNYNSKNTSTSLASSTVMDMVIDSYGNKWFATSGGVSKFDDTNWTVYRRNNNLFENKVSSITTDNSGNIWIGTYGGGISKFDGTNWTNYLVYGLNYANDYIKDICADQQNNIWCATLNGVTKFDGTGWTIYRSSDGLADDYVNSVTIDPSGNLWFGTENGVSKFDGSDWTTYTTADGLVYDYVNSISFDNLNNIWFATHGGGVSKFDGTTWTNYTATDGLASDYVQSIAIDDDDNIWFGTASGVTKFDGSSWVTYDQADGLVSDVLTKVLFDKQGAMWFCTYDGVSKFNIDISTKKNAQKTYYDNGISKIKVGPWTTYRPNGLVSSNLKTVDIDKQGKKWVGTWNGISIFNDTSWTSYTPYNGLSASIINDIAVVNESDVWVGSYYNGVSNFNGYSWTKYTAANGLAGYSVSSIAFTGKAYLFGTTGGISVFDGVLWDTITTKDGLINDSVNKILFDEEENKIWVGTNEGLSKFDGVSWTNYTMDNTLGGLIYDSITDLALDTAGALWCATPRGVSKFDGSSWTIYRADNTDGGLISDHIIDLDSDKHGNIWFCSDDGISKFDGTKWTKYNVVNEQGTSCIVRHIAIDSIDNKWIATQYDGLFVLSDQVILSSDTIFVESEGTNDAKIEITSSLSWTLSSTDTCLTLEKTSGKGNDTITVEVTANPDDSIRTAFISVSAPNIPSQTITIIQEAGPVKLSVSDTLLNVQNSANSTASFIIQSNTNWNIYGPEWLSISPSSGSDNDTITIAAMANLKETTRTTILEVAGNGIIKTIKIIQAPATPFISVSDSTLTIQSPANSTASFTIKSNTSWSITSSQTWLYNSPVSGSDTSIIILTATANPYDTIRTALVSVTGKNLGPYNVKIKQMPKNSTGNNEPSINEIKAYPNPVTNNITLIFPQEALPLTITLYDISGKELTKVKTSDPIEVLDMWKYKPGPYILKITTQEKTMEQKIIKK